jgi:hypothetical protein
MQNNISHTEIVDLVPYLRTIAKEKKEPEPVPDLLRTLKKEFGLVEVEG